MPVWKIALDIIEDVRGSIAMYMFIIEEAIQTLGMACYLAHKHKDYAKCRDLASYALNELVYPALDFARTYGLPAYPLNIAYEAFYRSAERTFKNYLELT